MGGRFMTPPRWHVRHTILEEGKNPFPQKLCFCGYDIMPSTGDEHDLGLAHERWDTHHRASRIACCIVLRRSTNSLPSGAPIITGAIHTSLPTRSGACSTYSAVA